MAASLVESAPWRSPLSTAIRKDENGTSDTFQHLEKLLASAVSICRLKGSVECQTGGLITVCEEMHRLLRCSFSEIARLEKEIRKLRTNQEEELTHLKEKIRNLEQEKVDSAKLNLDMNRRLGYTGDEEQLARDSQKMGLAQTPVPVEETLMDSSEPQSSEDTADDAACDETEEPVKGRSSKLDKGGKTRSDSNDSQEKNSNKIKSHKIEDVTVAVEDLSPVSSKRPISKKRLSSKKTGKQSHQVSPVSYSKDTHIPMSSDPEICDENVTSYSIDVGTCTSHKKKQRNSRKATAIEMKDDSKKTSDASTSTLPRKNSKNKAAVLEVQEQGDEIEGDDGTLEESALETKHLSSSALKRKDFKATGNHTTKSNKHPEPAKEVTEKVQEGESSHSLSKTNPKPENAKESKKIHEEKDEPLGDMSFLLDINLKISEFVTNSAEQELELPLMTGRQRTDVYKLAELYRVRARMGNKSDNLTTLRMSKTPESRMPKNGKVDCLLSELSIAATKEADSPKPRAGKRKHPTVGVGVNATKKHPGKARKKKA